MDRSTIQSGVAKDGCNIVSRICELHNTLGVHQVLEFEILVRGNSFAMPAARVYDASCEDHTECLRV
jgi:hypothetical protein